MKEKIPDSNIIMLDSDSEIQTSTFPPNIEITSSNNFMTEKSSDSVVI
jgi:hypothetical protein